MGCGSSRSPVRVGILMEDDESLYPELFPPLMDSWVQESARNAPSYLNSSSPPPYTPLPLSGHVTLMLSQGSPDKRLDSTYHSTINSRLSIDDGAAISEETSTSILEISSRERESVASHRREQREASPARPDMNGSYSSAEVMALLHTAEQVRRSSIDQVMSAGCPSPTSVDHPTTSGSPTGPTTDATDIPDTRSTSADTTADVDTSARRSCVPSPSPQDTLPGTLRHSFSFPPARPPSPFPRSRSLSSQLPPLTRIRPRDDPAGTPAPVPESREHTPFRLPPLALLRQQHPTVVEDSSGSNSGTTSTGHHKHKKRRVRSLSCQMQSSGLSSVQEQTVAIIQ